jgi:thiol-disulfide isomerase/thioredoxin
VVAAILPGECPAFQTARHTLPYGQTTPERADVRFAQPAGQSWSFRGRHVTVVDVDRTAWTGLVVAVVALTAATAFGLWRRRRDGRLRVARDGGLRATPAAPPGVLATLGVEPGAPATLLQFSSAFCAPCRAVRRVCADVAKTIDGVRHGEVDAESHLDAVRELGIWRTPTVLIVDRSGRVVQRASGVPAKGQVIAAVAPLLEAAA